VVKPVHLILANSFYSGRQLVYRHGDFVELKICQPSILCFFLEKVTFQYVKLGWIHMFCLMRWTDLFVSQIQVALIYEAIHC